MMTIRIPTRSEIPTSGSDWAADWLSPFEPIQLLSGGHMQTLVGNYWLRPALAIPVDTEAVEVDAAAHKKCHMTVFQNQSTLGRETHAE